MRQLNFTKINKQSGAALAISLIILLVLTLVVVSSSQNVVVQERMASAVRDAHVSLQAAESGLSQGETFLKGITGVAGFTNAGANGLYAESNGPTDLFDANTWLPVNTVSVTVLNEPEYTAQYFIETVGLIPDEDGDAADINVVGYGQTTGGGEVTGFRVVSRAQGPSGNADRIVVSYFAKRL